MTNRFSVKSIGWYNSIFNVQSIGRVLTVDPQTELFPITRRWTWFDGSRWQFTTRIWSARRELWRNGNLIADARTWWLDCPGPWAIQWRGHVAELPARFTERHDFFNRKVHWKLDTGASIGLARRGQKSFWPTSLTWDVVCLRAWPWLAPMATGVLTYRMSKLNS